MTAIERKQNTEKLLDTLGIPVFTELPPIEEENVIGLRTPEAIAERILILTYLNCVASEQNLRQEIITFLEKEGLWEKASEEEKRLFNKTELTDQDLTNIGWRIESIWLLLWVIEKVDTLDLPSDEVNPRDIFALLPLFMQSTTDFINSATIRSVSEILDQSDLIFRLNWAVQQSQSDGSNGMDLNQSIAYERYNALNWVTSVHREWDDN